MKNGMIVLLAILMAYLPLSCKKETDEEPPKIKRYYANQRFPVALNERIEVEDTLKSEFDPISGKSVHPVFTISFDSLVLDNRVFGTECANTDYTYAITRISMTKGNDTISKRFAYIQCINTDLPKNNNVSNIGLDQDTFFMFKTHPVALDSPYKMREDTSYYIEGIVSHGEKPTSNRCKLETGMIKFYSNRMDLTIFCPSHTASKK